MAKFLGDGQVKDVRRPIAFFIPALNGGGAQRVVVNLANALVQLTNRPIHVVLVRREGQFLSELRPEIKVFSLGKRHTVLSLVSLAVYLRKERPAVLMSSMNYVNIAAVLAHYLAGRPGRLVLREANVFAPKYAQLGLRTRVLRMLMKLSYRFADGLIANSQDTMRSLLHNGITLPNNSVVIGNPVILPDAEAREGIPQITDSPYICAIGRLVPQKGFDFLLKGLAACKNKDLHVVILGEGPLRETLLRQARSLGLQDRLHLPGFINPPTDVLLKSKAFVLSSRWEGFGNVIVEALSLGVPVISTTCPGGPREILDYGRYGELIPIDDIGALASAIEGAVECPIVSPDERRKRAREYAPDSIVETYLARVLGPSRRAGSVFQDK